MRVLRVMTAALVAGALSTATAMAFGPYEMATEQIDAGFERAVDAYVYLYPLVLMDVTRQQATQASPEKAFGRGPANTFVHARTFPPAGFRDVVRPNFDTLYSTAWLDLTNGPVVLSVPDTGGRYYLLQLIDMWTDVFADPGARTTGTGEHHFAIVPPGWEGELPAAVEVIHAPTAYVWVVGRTQTNGPSDYDAVHQIQDGYRITPLGGTPAYGQPYGGAPYGQQGDEQPYGEQPYGEQPYGQPDVNTPAAVDPVAPPMEQVARMDAATFFDRAATLLREQSPHGTDWPMIADLRKLGLDPEAEGFTYANADPAVRDLLARAVPEAQRRIEAKATALVPLTNGWQILTEGVGVYGNDYLRRAAIAHAGLGANLPKDAIYPTTGVDAEGVPLTGDNTYVLHFEPGQEPPAGAFWSVTLYDAQGFQVPNALDRFALGDRDPMLRYPDGSLDLFISRASPGPGREGNWLPAPEGPFTLTMRLYEPAPSALNGQWAPPPVRRSVTTPLGTE